MPYFATGAALTAALNALPKSLTGTYKAFDAFYYAGQYMTSYNGTLTPIEHFVTYGASRGHQPNSDFNPAYYQGQFADLAGLDAADLLFHYVKYGLNEGRAGNATLAANDWNAYLTAYPDVAAYVNANLASFGGSATNGAIAHYVKFGAQQGFVLPAAGQTFMLTAGVDNASARTFNSQPGYNPGGTDFINTLQDEDVLTGAGTNPTLNVTLGSVNDAAEAMITPVLNGIETVNVQITGQTVEGINFQGATGLNTLNVTRITANNAEVTFDDLDATVTNIGLSNATREGVVTFDYREDVLTKANDVLNVTLNNVRMSEVNISEGGDSNEDQGYGFEKVNITVNGASNIDHFHLAENEKGAEQEVIITANAALEVNHLDVSGAEKIEINANADVMIARNEDDVLSAGNDGIDSDHLKTMTIKGAGDVTIDGLGGDTKLGTDVIGGTMTGDLTLGVEGVTAALAGTSVTSGSGNDEIETYGRLAGDIATNAGNDDVTIGGDMAGTASIDTAAGNDNVSADDMNATATDESKDNSTYGEVTAASISTGAGDDTVTVGSLNNEVDWNHGDVEDSNVDDLYNLVGASISTGAGNDTVAFVDMADGTLIDTGDGNDTINVELSGGHILADDDTNANEVNTDDTVNTVGAQVKLGAGDDVANFAEVASIDGEGEHTETILVGSDALLAGGTGTNTLNVTALDEVFVTESMTGTDGDGNGADGFNAYVTGFQTVNLTIANQIADDTNLSVDQNDNIVTDGLITIDVQRFDSALTTINLVSEERALLETPETEDWQDGSATKFDIANLREGVAVTLSANEVNTDGTNLKDDEAVDVELVVGLVAADGGNDTFTLDLLNGNAGYTGDEDFDISLRMVASASFPPAASPAAFAIALPTDTTDYMTENVVINLEGGGSHLINMNGFGDDDFNHSDDNVLSFMQWRNLNPLTNRTEVAYNAALAADQLVNGQGHEVATSLTIGETGAGEKITVVNVNADAISITGAADVALTVDNANNYTIVTGSGDDVVDMTADLVDDEDAINLGAGDMDRLIIAGDNSMGFDDTVQTENDEVWANKSGIEILEISTVDLFTPDDDEGEFDAGKSVFIVLDEEAFATGIKAIEFTGEGDVNHVIVIGEDFAASELSLSIDNSTDSVSLELRNYQDTLVTLGGIGLDADGGAEFELDDQYDLAGVDLRLTLASAGAATTIIDGDGNDGTVTDGTIELTAEALGEFDSITLVDNNNGDELDNGNVSLTTHDDWANAGSVLTIDASAIDDLDEDTETGVVTIDGSDEVDASYIIHGSDNDDSLTGAANATAGDEINGGLGDDEIVGLAGNDELNGNDGDDQIFGDEILEVNINFFVNGFVNAIVGGADTIDGGAGNDLLFGGAGNDTITSGTGTDYIIGGLGADLIDLSGSTGSALVENEVVNVDVLVYGAAEESMSTLAAGGYGVDVVTGFNVGTRFTGAPGQSSNSTNFTDANVGDVIVLAFADGFLGTFSTSLEAQNALGAVVEEGNYAVFIASENLLLVDDGDGLVEESDFQVVLTGVTAITSDNILTLPPV